MIENEEYFGFIFPQLYKRIVEENRVIYDNESYLWLPEAEWIQPNEMISKEILPL